MVMLRHLLYTSLARLIRKRRIFYLSLLLSTLWVAVGVLSTESKGHTKQQDFAKAKIDGKEKLAEIQVHDLIGAMISKENEKGDNEHSAARRSIERERRRLRYCANITLPKKTSSRVELPIVYSPFSVTNYTELAEASEKLYSQLGFRCATSGELEDLAQCVSRYDFMCITW